ncbi:5-formyltetrahydrofolate cyclo-ligase [Asticcacaulis sp.]|uniref:5-formyltetrahydrofolate cyclo-ligase n=1 Tax=Asticcacaulis sp. TaxID=1872648 RepID=UPI002C3BFD9F|nr:5-formyltetrahydrofolate cyclo-ligase [Asticcacaulis sp.]HTM81071.1 5-formyltetrahydrofolate cyclo-ligase [Asticcacaulis sp.]
MLTADQKPLLRNEMKRRRAAFAQGSPLAGDMLAEIALDHLDARRQWPAKDVVIGGYWPIQSEINPFPLMQVFKERGYALALPCLVAEGEEFHMIFRRFSLGDDLVSGPFDIHQPADDADEIAPDLVLLPLLAFDEQGWRLGYGGGYYDRVLVRLRAQKDMKAYGVAFSGQQLAEVPFEVHDQPLDGIFTDQSVIHVRSKV